MLESILGRATAYTYILNTCPPNISNLLHILGTLSLSRCFCFGIKCPIMRCVYSPIDRVLMPPRSRRSLGAPIINGYWGDIDAPSGDGPCVTFIIGVCINIYTELRRPNANRKSNALKTRCIRYSPVPRPDRIYY